MTYERFVKQLDGCTYCSGGLNCSCACEAMWLYRASQGRIKTTACAVRRATGDRVEGTNLEQMANVSASRGLTGTLYRPATFRKVRQLVQTGRYGAIIQVGYSAIAGTDYDCFGGSFRGGHAMYLSRGTDKYGHVADPGADGRRPTIPEGYQDIPWALLENAAGHLPLNDSGLTLADAHGSGFVYAYLTPADPILATSRFLVSIGGYTTLYTTPNGSRVGAVSAATYVAARSKVNGIWWYRIISKQGGGKTANAGRYFKPNRTVIARST